MSEKWRWLSRPIAILALMSLGCVSSTRTVYNPAPLKAITSWDIGFLYGPGAIAETSKDSGRTETTIVQSGHPARDLQLRDNIFFLLQDKYHLTVSNDGRAAEGAIRMLPVHFYSGGFKSLDVRFEDRDGRVLARLQIKNSDRNCCFKNDDSFAKYAADKIAKVVETAGHR